VAGAKIPGAGILGSIGFKDSARGLIPVPSAAPGSDIREAPIKAAAPKVPLRRVLPDAAFGKVNPVNGEIPQRDSPIPYSDGRFSNTGQEGYRRRSDGSGKPHGGIDIMAPIDTPVVAAAGGIAGSGKINGYGNVVYVQHPNGEFTVYGHLGRGNVTQFQPVQRGQVIGYSGVTGNAKPKAPHLHFETWKGGLGILPQGLSMPGVSERPKYRVDPEHWLQTPLK
jgi:murein DD-endopeptidase MepM/ murein hydrolase activator NlpD